MAELLEATTLSKSSVNIEDASGPRASTSKNENIEKYLSLKYEFFFNTIKHRPEYRELGTTGEYIPIDDNYLLNSFKRELDANGLFTSPDNVLQILESSFSPKVNPIRHYFKTLPKWDKQTDYIKILCNTVTVENPNRWYEYFKKWIVAVVANATNLIGCQNHTCLVLAGEQGKFKTTWLDNLCPKILSSYLYTGKIDPNNKDTLSFLAEYLFINIDDQLLQLNKKDANNVKNSITTPSVKFRPPYGRKIKEFSRLASYMASINGKGFLVDPTGSRRFLPFEVLDINIHAAKQIDMQFVYIQAMTLYNEGFRYWFNDEEIAELYENNREFQVESNEEQLLQHYFRKPDNRLLATHTYSTAYLQTIIENYTKQRLSTKRLGEALTKLGFEKFQKQVDNTRTWVWAVVEKSGHEIEEQNKNNEAAI